MLAAGVCPEAAVELLSGREERVSLAAVNGPSSVTLAGESDALAEIAASLERAGRFCRRLPVRVPYHCPHMEALREELLDALGGLDCREHAIPVVSTVAGAWAHGQPFDAGYWWRNVRQPVQFASAVDQLAREGFGLFLKLSPHPVLAAPVLECLAERDADASVLPTLRRNDDERRTMLRSLAILYASGRDLDWRGVLGGDGACVRLPSYPWQRERHWFEPTSETATAAIRSSAGGFGVPAPPGRRTSAARS